MLFIMIALDSTPKIAASSDTYKIWKLGDEICSNVTPETS